MRTIRRLCTAMAVAMLVAGVFASCALPPYESSGSSSGSGGSAATSGSSSSSSGQGGHATQGSVSASVSSSSGSSSSGNATDAGTDSGPDCPPVTACGVNDTPMAACMCDKSVCLDSMCKSDNDAAAGQGLVCTQGHWLAVPASLGCCPNMPACAANSVCVTGVALGPNMNPKALVSECKSFSCPPGKTLDCNCFGGQDPCVLLQVAGTCKVNAAKTEIFCVP